MTAHGRIPGAAAWVRGDADHPDLRGRVTFTPLCDGTLVTADICGLPESEAGFFAFHIHEGGDCRGAGFPDTKGHYNPGNMPHPMHAGDLPPLLSCGGTAHLAVKTGRFRVREIIGRTVIIHAHPDDFKTQPSGDSGSKIACGVICRT